MFSNCKALNTLPNLEKWNISNVKNLNYMFAGCQKYLKIPMKFMNKKNNK